MGVGEVVRMQPSASAGWASIGSRTLVWAGASIGPALAAWGLALAILNGLDARRVMAEFVAVNATAALGFSVVGGLIASRRPSHVVGWLCIGIGLASGASVSAGQYARYALFTAPGSVPGGVLAAWANLWLWLLVAAGVAIYLPLLFPNGRLPSARWRPLLWLATIATLASLVVGVLNPRPDASLPEANNPLATSATLELLRVLAPLAVLLTAASGIGVLASMVTRYRAASDRERHQLKWFISAVVAVVVVIAGSAALYTTAADGDTLLSGTLQALVVPLVPAAVGVAILRYRLYDIDLLINRTLVYVSLTASVVALYVGVVEAISALLRTQGNVAVSLLTTGIVAVLFQPARERLQRGVNRLMYGQRNEPYAVLAKLDRRLEASLASEDVLPTIVATVRGALRLPYVAISLGAGPEAPVVASGAAGAELVGVPVVYRGEHVGELRLAPRVPGEELSPADRHLLEELARHAGAAAHAVRLTGDLRRARERVVRAREEERRRLRRDLHDGLGPRLASLTLRLEAARDRLAIDRETASLLEDLTERTRGAVTEVRRLVRGLRPPALDDLGLGPALREVADQYSFEAGAGFRVDADIPEDLPPLPAAVEVATYRIAQEALTNVARHAQARRCALRVRLDPFANTLHLELSDDGRGLDPAAPPGVGLASMRERAEEVGGTCAYESGPTGGTRVHAILPCGRTFAAGNSEDEAETSQ